MDFSLGKFPRTLKSWVRPGSMRLRERKQIRNGLHDLLTMSRPYLSVHRRSTQTPEAAEDA